MRLSVKRCEAEALAHLAESDDVELRHVGEKARRLIEALAEVIDGQLDLEEEIARAARADCGERTS